MMYTLHYDSPLGGILLAADEVGLTGLWFDGEKYFADTLDPEHKAQETPILREAKRWLDVYFRGQEPDFTPPLHPIGSPFRQEVWALIVAVPLALWLGDDSVEKALMIGSVLLLLIVELLNSAVEAVVDRTGMEPHKLSGRAKDMGSAAVLLAIINVVVIWLLMLS